MKKLLFILILIAGCTATPAVHVVDFENMSKKDIKEAYLTLFKEAEILKTQVEDLQKEIDAQKFPWDIFLGFMSLGAVATVVLLITPFKKFAPIAMAGFVTMATLACADQYKWQVVGGFVLIVALTIILILLTKLKPFKELVSKLETSKEKVPDLAPVLKVALKGNLSPETEKAIKNERAKIAKSSKRSTNSPTPGATTPDS